MNDITNKKINSRLDELNKKMDYNIHNLGKINSIFRELKQSYNGIKSETVYPDKFDTMIVTFAGNPIKLIRNHHYR